MRLLSMDRRIWLVLGLLSLTSVSLARAQSPTYWTSAEVAAPDSIEGQLRSEGMCWTRTQGEIAVGAYVQDILEGRLDQPKGRGAIGKVVSVAAWTANGKLTATVDFGRGYSVGIYFSELCPVSVVPGPKAGPQPLNIDFGVWKPSLSTQTGPAAAGSAGDFWNAVAVPWNNAHTETGLKFVSGNPSPIQVTMLNLGGAWTSGGGMGVKSPMLDTFNYPVNNRGGNSRVILEQVPPGKYDVYVYGHKPEALYYGDYTLTVGECSYGRKTTFHKDDAGQKTEWVEGSQYVKFTGVKVKLGDDVEILIRPGGEITVPQIEGIGDQVPVVLDSSSHAGAKPSAVRRELKDANSEPSLQTKAWSGDRGPIRPEMPYGDTGRRFCDAMICGLQLIPAE